MNLLITNYLQKNIDNLSHEAIAYYRDYQYYCFDKILRKMLINILKSRSQFKRALKEYKKQCEFIRIEKYKKLVKIWKEHTDKFIEDIYGFKLMWYQKVMLKMNWDRRKNMRKYYTCSNCTVLFDTNDIKPICPHCKTQAYGFKYKIHNIFQWDKIKPILLGLFFAINSIVWIFGLITVLDILIGA